MEKRTLDNFMAQGNTVEEFNKELLEMSKVTGSMSVKAKDLVILSKGLDSSDEKKMNVFFLQPDDIWDKASNGAPVVKTRTIDRDRLEKSTPKMLEEYENTTNTLIYTGEDLYFTSSELNNTLSMRSGVAGPAMYTPSLERNILIAKGLDSDTTLKAVYRKENGRKKIFSLMSDRYKYEPNTCLSKILKEIDTGIMGKMTCNKWYIDQSLSEIYVEFLDKASELSTIYGLEDTFVPGIYLAKSDIGECSVTVRSTWRTGSSIIVESELRKKNTKNLDIDDIIETVKNTVFANYTKMPEIMCDLMSTDITDPSIRATKTLEEIEVINKELISDVLTYAFKQIDIASAIGKRRTKQIMSDLIASIDPELDYTAYDVCMMIMTIPESITGIPRADIIPLQIACGKAPRLNYGEATKAAVLIA